MRRHCRRFRFANACGVNVETRNKILRHAMSPLLQTGITGDAPAIIKQALQRSGAEFRVRCSGNLPAVVIRITAFDTISSSHSASIQARRPAASIGSPFAGVAQARFGAHPSRLSYRYDAAPAARRRGCNATLHGSARHKVGAGLPPGARLPPVLCSLRRD